MNSPYDLIGIGVGPFNLSLAALIAPLNRIKARFLDNKSRFSWHEELMFSDATMQTSYLKDLVTPVDPTNPYSFLNYLVKRGQFYHFLNTGRKTVSRMEFEEYCKWVAEELKDIIHFDSEVIDVEFKTDQFQIHTKKAAYSAQHLCIASGPIKNIPDCAKSLQSEDVFHAKSSFLKAQNFANQRVLIVGGGQTGVEIFRNALSERWGRVNRVTLISGRENLRPLDEGPFTNEVFTPEFVSNFYSLPQDTKDHLSERLLLASDGNTPDYLQELYNELYMERYYFRSRAPFQLLPMRWMTKIEKRDREYKVHLSNLLTKKNEEHVFDKIILATGFRSELPNYLRGIREHIEFDSLNRPVIDRDYRLKTNFSQNHIYSMNFSRHGHGIADPQTSLMSWRSAIIANKVLNKEVYQTRQASSSFLNFYNEQG